MIQFFEISQGLRICRVIKRVLQVFGSVLLCFIAQTCPTLCDPVDCSPPGSSVHGDSPGMNTGVGCHDLLQGIFPTQGTNPGLLRWQAYSLPLSH